MIETSLQEIIEKEKIIGTATGLFIKTDERDWESVKNCFTENVLFDMTSMTGGTPEELSSQEIVDSWKTGLKDLHAIHHQVGNYIVSLNNDEADFFCYGTASHYLPNPSGNNTRTFVGTYNFHLVKLNDEWKINMFKFNLKFIDGNEELK